MNGLISIENISLQPISEKILSLNSYSSQFGLTLTPESAKELSDTRAKSIMENERIEIGVGALPDILKKFCTSHYVNNDNYTYILNEVTYLFYYIKTETDDKISDNKLIDELFERFELHCRGSIDTLVNREAERIIRKVNSGEKYAEWYKDRDELDYDSATGARDTPKNIIEDEYEEGYFNTDTPADHDNYEADNIDEPISDDEDADYLDVFDEFFDNEALMHQESNHNHNAAKENPDDDEEKNNGE